MTAWVGVAGAALLSASLVPQTWKLIRTRRAHDFGWPFVILNLFGLSLLAVRSAQLGQAAFLVVNSLGAAFWLLVLGTKTLDGGRGAPRVHASPRANSRA